MSDIRTLSAEARERVGKGSARAARRNGRVPAVIYGDKKAPQPITLAINELTKEIHLGQFSSKLFALSLDGKIERVIPKDVQFHPVNDIPQHVDFLRVSKDARVTVEVPAHFINEEESPGLRRGGVLNVVRHTIELSCPVDAIPESIEISLTDLDINDGIHISAVKLPEGVSPAITDRDFTIATIAAPSRGVEEEGEAEEGEIEEGEEEVEEGEEE